MNWDAHRRDYAAYCETRVAAAYRQHAGFTLAQPIAAIIDRYRDLWRRDTLAEMAHDLATAEVFTALERTSRRALLDALRLLNVHPQTAEITAELARFQAVTWLMWQDQSITAENFAACVAQETRPAQRLEIVQRWGELQTTANDLRTELWQQSRHAAQALGFDNLTALTAEISATNPAKLAQDAANFLQTTEKIYRHSLAQRAPHWRPNEIRPQLNYADWLFWLNQTAPHPAFPAHDLLPTYSDTVRGLGWRMGSQTNVIIDVTPRTGKRRETAYYPIKPPDEVRLIAWPQNGFAAYREFFTIAGRAQHHAWTARDLQARHPALVYAADSGLNVGYGALWRGFTADAGWLREYRPALSPDTAHQMAANEAFTTLALLRRDCALLLYHLAADEHDKPDETLAREKYVAALSEATGFQHDLAFAVSALDVKFNVLTRLRGQLLAASLSEYLRVRYGRRWWAVKRAGDDLIDWWNTGSRYHAEEIAPLIGAGALSFDLLAEQLTAAAGSRQ